MPASRDGILNVPVGDARPWAGDEDRPRLTDCPAFAAIGRTTQIRRSAPVCALVGVRELPQPGQPAVEARHAHVTILASPDQRHGGRCLPTGAGDRSTRRARSWILVQSS